MEVFGGVAASHGYEFYQVHGIMFYDVREICHLQVHGCYSIAMAYGCWSLSGTCFCG